MDTIEQKAPQMATVKGGLTPYLMVDGAAKAAEFYQRAFAAEIAASHPPDAKGRTMHVHVYINGSSLMLSDPFPDYGRPAVKPQGFNLTLQVKDIEAWWKRAVDAGAEVVMPIADMFWGARYGQLRDPFGVEWALNEQKD
jgi:PhnB protein